MGASLPSEKGSPRASLTAGTPSASTRYKADPTAGWLSFLLPGLGQVYQGWYARGLTLFTAFTLISLFRDGRILLPVAAFLAGFEAYRPKAKREWWAVWEEELASYWARYFKDPSRPNRLRKPCYIAVGVMGFLGWFFLFAPALYPFEAQARLNDSVDLLADRVREYRAAKGNIPPALSEVLHATDAQNLLIDPWGQSLLIRATPEGFEIVSKGKDRTESTQDDFRYRFR